MTFARGLVYKKLKIRPVVLLAIIAASMSVMNLLPWGGPTARVAAILKVDVNTVWVPMIPMQIFGFLLAVAFSAYLGMVEKRRGAGYVEGEVLTGEAAEDAKEEAKLSSYSRPKLFWFNLILTLAVIAMLVAFSKLPAYFPFMLGTALALVVNYSSKEQTALIKQHAANALSVPAILLASGIFLGVFNGTGMLNQLAAALIAIIPDSMGPHLPILMGATAVPVGMLLGTDAYIFGLIPLAIEVGAKFGISATTMADAMLIGKNYGVLVTPHAATTFLAVGLAGVSLKELLTYVFPRVWILSLLAVIFGLTVGLIPTH